MNSYVTAEDVALARTRFNQAKEAVAAIHLTAINYMNSKVELINGFMRMDPNHDRQEAETFYADDLKAYADEFVNALNHFQRMGVELSMLEKQRNIRG